MSAEFQPAPLPESTPEVAPKATPEATPEATTPGATSQAHAVPAPDAVEPSVQAGHTYWRSLEEHADSPEFRKAVAEEFPGYDPDELMSLSRRKFMKLAGASMALAGLTLTGCRRWPVEHLAPFANRPDDRMPGVPVWYASMQERGGVAQGVLVQAFDGRPIKVEGNPQHPISQGASDVFTQASTLTMYDPARSRQVVSYQNGSPKQSDWRAFEQSLSSRLSQLSDGGATLAVLSEATSSPTVQRLRRQLQQRYPGMTWATYEPVNHDNAWAGAQMAFGRVVRPQYDWGKAKIIACFDTDALTDHPAALALARGWAKGRKSADTGRMNRMYIAEPSFTPTGTVADERVAVTPSRVGALVFALAAQLGVLGGGRSVELNGESAFISHLAKDLQANRGAGLVMVGPNQPAEVHALAHAINDRLGNHGQTITFADEPLVNDQATGYVQQLRDLTDKMAGGDVDTLVMLGGNPVFDAPADIDFAGALKQVQYSAHLALYQNETSLACGWHVNRAHALESWGDGRSWDGTLSVQQPQIMPLFEGKTPAELLATMLDVDKPESREITRATFGTILGGSGEGFERAWRRVLHDGFLADSQAPGVEVQVAPDGIPDQPPASSAKDADQDSYEVVFNPHATIYDGRFANNAWLQETPEPVTKLTWDNPARVSIKDARRLGLSNGDTIELSVNGRTLTLPVFLMQGQAPGVIHLTLGHGRTEAGPIGGINGETVGFDTYTLRTADNPGFTRGATIKYVDSGYDLAATQNHQLIQPLDYVAKLDMDTRIGLKGQSGILVKEASLTEYLREKDFAHEDEVQGGRDISLQLYSPPQVTDHDGENPQNPAGPKYFNEPHAWGMAIDMNSCIGCSSCMVACQSENNVPVVGKEQVLYSREMHWLRVDTYYKGDPADASGVQAVHQPLACVQCENAPCEQVCPVAATVHDTEGLNVMVYNRCIGTRYCSNNCPYKVRRFNYLDYHARSFDTALLPWLGMPDQEQEAKVDQISRMRFNPDVTVRMRGVMEKCTYCVQRINRAKINAQNEYQQGHRQNPEVKDGEITTACQSSCPTQAIVFGNLNDPDSRVSKLQQDNHRSYQLLEELNTRARTQHMAKIRNPAAPAPGSTPGSAPRGHGTPAEKTHS